jgi:hypothetical protein
MSILKVNKIQNISGIDAIDMTTSGLLLANPSSVSGTSIIDSEYLYTLTDNRTIVATVVGATYYSMFGVGLTVPVGVYRFFINSALATGTTSHTVSFALGGTATIQDTQFFVDFLNVASSIGTTTPSTATAPTRVFFNANSISSTANGVISPASVTATKSFTVTGIIRISGTGTINPQIGFSANPTGTNAVARGSHFSITPIGKSINSNISYGVWS